MWKFIKETSFETFYRKPNGDIVSISKLTGRLKKY